ncbi:MAG: hypothetical protein ACRD4X_11800 [Candidatus Acidiferrales bacterium]
MARRRTNRGGSLPHAQYGVDLSKVPDTYIEPFTAYRAWNWTEDGKLTSLNHAEWTPKQAFVATCNYVRDHRSMVAAATTPAAKKFWEQHAHHVPDPTCTCGMYAGINMQHMIDIDYIGRGIHGEVWMWGRLMRHELGWRAQYAYPKYFVVPVNMVSYSAAEAQQRLATLVEFDVDIYLQPERATKVGQQTIPLWMRHYGYCAQGTEFLVERWRQWNSKKIVRTLGVGDRLAVFSDFNGGGIGVVKEIRGDDVYFTLFSPRDMFYTRLKDIVWNERNWRWEASGLGSPRKLALGGNGCLS